MFDVIVSGGEVYDGDGKPGFAADIGISGAQIAAIGDLAGAECGERIDARGRAVAPGFIDIHTHSDFTLLVDGSADSQLCQGVTSEVIGQCGFSCAPIRPSVARDALVGFHDAGVEIDWTSFGQYLDRLDQAGLGVNVAALVGHGSIHRAVKGEDNRALDAGDVDAMVRLADAALEEGAFGLSTGLEYWPGNAAPPEAIEAMVGAAARKNALYATHVRNRDVYYDLGFTEAIAYARHAGARLQISHIQPKFGAPKHAMADTFELLARAAREDVDVAFDVIPHDWNHTFAVAALPGWAREGGTARTLARLGDAGLRDRLKNNPTPIWRVIPARRWDIVRLLVSKANPHLVGLTFAEIGRQRGVDPHDALLDLLREEGEDMAQMMMTSQSFSDADICMCMRHADCSVMSDTMALSPRGALKNTVGSLSGYGWTARLLGHYVRERGVLTLAEGINRITGRPADRIGLADRGRLRVGAQADIVVFDPATIAARGTFAEPKAHPVGIDAVLVNGVLAVRGGRRTDARTGRVLRRKTSG